MSTEMLVTYIRLAVHEASLKRDAKTVDHGTEDELNVNEFAGVGCGGIMGFSGPLDDDNVDRPTASVSPKRKRQK